MLTGKMYDEGGSALRPLDKYPNQVILTKRLQVADIIEHVLRYTGPADLWQTTFSVSEEFLRRMFNIARKGRILSANVILDYKGTQKTLKLWHFISNVFDTAYLADNHSKILLAKGRESGRTVAVVTSQNLTRGNRYESSMLTTDPGVYASLLSDWEAIARMQSIPLHELLGKTDKGH